MDDGLVLVEMLIIKVQQLYIVYLLSCSLRLGRNLLGILHMESVCARHLQRHQ